MLVALLCLGAAGYVALEEMTVGEALYMTVITLTTVGFGEVRPLSPHGRYFTIMLLAMGFGVTAYGVRNAVEVALGDRLWLAIEERGMTRHLEELDKHYIICGYGRMGREIAGEFQRRGEHFVVIERSETWRVPLIESNVPHIIGDATTDDALLAAGIERAQGLLAVVNSEADNVLIVLSAKGLNPTLKIHARAATSEIESKLRRAGADHVTSPYVIGAQRMASAMMRPAVYAFSKRVIFSVDPQSEMGQIVIQPESIWVGQTLRMSGLREQWGASVIAILQADGKMIVGPTATHRICAGETLVVVAPTEVLQQLEQSAP